jgi:hypothetical protein
MTPYETWIYVEEQRREQMTRDWVSAKLAGAKVPDLDTWLKPKKAKSADPSMDAKAFFMASFPAKFNNKPNGKDAH